jgi:hypothetical protein
LRLLITQIPFTIRKVAAEAGSLTFLATRGLNRPRDIPTEVLAKHHVAISVSVPEVVPDWMENLAKYWSEWQDLNLRPPRPERGSGPAKFASELLNTAQDEAEIARR